MQTIIVLIVVVIALPIGWMAQTAMWAFRHAKPDHPCGMCKGTGRCVYVSQGGRESTFRCDVCGGDGARS